MGRSTSNELVPTGHNEATRVHQRATVFTDDIKAHMEKLKEDQVRLHEFISIQKSELDTGAWGQVRVVDNGQLDFQKRNIEHGGAVGLNGTLSRPVLACHSASIFNVRTIPPTV